MWLLLQLSNYQLKIKSNQWKQTTKTHQEIRPMHQSCDLHNMFCSSLQVVLFPPVVCFCHCWFCLFVRSWPRVVLLLERGTCSPFTLPNGSNTVRKNKTHMSNVSDCISQLGCKTDLPLSVRPEKQHWNMCSIVSFRFTWQPKVFWQ